VPRDSRRFAKLRLFEASVRNFTRGSRQINISVNMIMQNLFHQGRYFRDMSFNFHYVVALKNVRDKKQFMYVANQISGCITPT